MQDFIINFDGQSLFHVFAWSDTMIQCIHDKYMLAKQNDLLTHQEYRLPLLILSPDIEQKTAIFRSI